MPTHDQVKRALQRELDRLKRRQADMGDELEQFGERLENFIEGRTSEKKAKPAKPAKGKGGGIFAESDEEEEEGAEDEE